jgi:hypothetical protein
MLCRSSLVIRSFDGRDQNKMHIATDAANILFDVVSLL